MCYCTCMSVLCFVNALPKWYKREQGTHWLQKWIGSRNHAPCASYNFVFNSHLWHMIKSFFIRSFCKAQITGGFSSYSRWNNYSQLYWLLTFTTYLQHSLNNNYIIIKELQLLHQESGPYAGFIVKHGIVTRHLIPSKDNKSR